MAENSKALLGGGCFWCLEALFTRIDGVTGVRSGYAGGERPDPSYEEVCGGRSGHAEVVEIDFDPGVISYREILDAFWKVHDPTQLNRQGNDVGTQYRSVIFYYGDQQKQDAHDAVAAEAKNHASPVVTEITQAPAFYPAEPYHDKYYDRHPGAPYCRAIIAPKLRKANLQ